MKERLARVGDVIGEMEGASCDLRWKLWGCSGELPLEMVESATQHWAALRNFSHHGPTKRIDIKT